MSLNRGINVLWRNEQYWNAFAGVTYISLYVTVLVTLTNRASRSLSVQALLYPVHCNNFPHSIAFSCYVYLGGIQSLELNAPDRSLYSPLAHSSTMSTSSVRKRLYDPEKGRVGIHKEDEELREIRPNSSLSSVAIVIGMGLLLVLLGVKWRDRSSSNASMPINRVVGNVASAITASSASNKLSSPSEDSPRQQEQEQSQAEQPVVEAVAQVRKE